MRTDVIFTTVCISDDLLDINRRQFKGTHHYFQAANILVNSVLKYTGASIIVVTDIPEEFKFQDRVIVYDIRELTDEPTLVHGYFNLHLKRFALKKAFDRNETYVVYLDCDVFLDNHMSYELFNELDSMDVDVIGKLGVSNIRGMNEVSSMVVDTKIKEFGTAWNDKFFEATLPFEFFLIFKKNIDKQTKFFETWSLIAEQSLRLDQPTYADSYYMGCSILNAEMKQLNLVTHGSQISTEFLQNLRIIHGDMVNTIDIVKLEVFDYDTLLRRMK